MLGLSIVPLSHLHTSEQQSSLLPARLMTKPLCFLVIVPCVLASLTHPPVPELFQNTLRRWNVQPLHDKDRLERWNRFVKFVKSVKETTSQIHLESLNGYTILNDAEFETVMKPIMTRSFNMSDMIVSDEEIENHPVTKREKRKKRALAAVSEMWEKEVGLTTPGDQAACGSCWSFPNVGTIEALTKKLSGELIKYSEQYFVDCTFTYSGCAGGTVNEGYKLTLMRQYMLSAKTWPYTADYAPCKWTADIESGNNNAMTKIWVQDYLPLSKTEEAVLGGLVHSPVAFGSYISDNIFGYSGGIYDDSLCATQATPHAMLLVGYTETTLRVKASYGTIFGDYGYINYKRGSPHLVSCRVYDTAFALTATWRREMEYTFCSEKKLVTRSECKDSCLAMNTDTETGWNLASIPTRYHNEQIVSMVNELYPGVKTDDKFNYLWMGLEDLDKDESLNWIDDFIPVNYVNITDWDSFGWGKIYGTINKNTGAYMMKGSLTATHRGVCGRAVTCWDISTAVANGDVTFDRERLTEGTVATPKCDSGYTLTGESSLRCVGGIWDKTLPTCTQNSGPQCQAPTITGGTVTPTTAISTGASYSVSCNSGFTLKGQSTVSCTESNGKATLSTLPTCEKDTVELKCEAPTITGGTVTPTTAISTGASYAVSCNSGFTLKGQSTVSCTENNGKATLSTLPTCEKDTVELKCEAPTITGGTVTPTTAISTGASYSVSCNSGFTLKGQSTVSCTESNGKATLSTLPTCEKDAVELKCEAPTITGGTVTPTTTISTGASYSASCNSGFTLKGQSTVSCTENNGKATLSTLPTCEKDAAPTCTKPVIAGGEVSPTDNEIAVGAVYTVTCNAHHKMKGEAEMTCSKSGDTAVLSAAPECEEETCDPKKAEITDGTIESGKKDRYVYGDKIVYKCNDNFVVEGNTAIECTGSKFSSNPPNCIAINTNCDQFTVTNGLLSNHYPYFSTDKVRVSCETDYIVAGKNPRICQNAGWKTDAPTCTKSDGEQCISLVPPQDGTITCTGQDNDKNVAGTQCTVGCLDTFQPIPGSISETTCSKNKFLWTHQTSSNPEGVFPPCTKMIAPTTKKVKIKVTIKAEYCTNDEQKTLMEEAVKAFLKDSLSITGLQNGKCEVSDVECVYKTEILLKFNVVQTQDLLDKSLLNEAKSEIKKSVKANTFTISIADGKRRKRRATTLSADSDSLESEDEVVCAEGEVVEDGVCVKCPAGYKTVNGACEACQIGTYNAAEGAIDCIACEGDKTTYGTGSTKQDQCYDLCTVPDIAAGTLNKEAGFKVEPTYTLTLSCEETYSASVASFQCSSYSSTQHKCNPLQQCKPSVVTLENGSISGAAAPYEQGEMVTFACNAQYKLIGDSAITCNNRVWSNAAPLCKPVNTACPAYAVTNGKVEDKSTTFVTAESVSVECDYGYDLNGTNPRVCETAGWTTAAQTCIKNEGKCPALTAPQHGTISCTGTSITDTCTVTCNAGYTYLGDTVKVTCQEGLRWTHQSYKNSRGDFAACAEVQTPESRVLEAELFLDVDYCRTEQEKTAVVSAFETYIKSAAAAVPCISGAKCTVQKTSCGNSDGSNKVTFELAQTAGELSAGSSTLTSSDSRIKDLVNTKAMSFGVTTSKKRATTTFTAEDGSYTGNVKTACADGQAQLSDSCIACPAGHKLVVGSTTVCSACPVGSFSTTANSNSCEECAAGLTTYGTGSTSSGDCLKLCKVPGVTHGTLTPPTGYNVPLDTSIKMTCNTGYILDTGSQEFVCSTGPVPTCKEDGVTEEVSGGGNTTTVVIVVVVVVVLLIALGVGAVIFLKKRKVKRVSGSGLEPAAVLVNKSAETNGHTTNENPYDTRI
ncbi:hypothetical protein ACHWQZ_G007910 [Mnemiopsis leidyi]